MCVSAPVSFSLGGLLIAGGAFCLVKTRHGGKAYLPLSLMPVAVGMQQMTEGVVWHGLQHGQSGIVYAAARIFLLFVWLFWPSWTAFMTASLETNAATAHFLRRLSAAGLMFGIVMYTPYTLHPDWLSVSVNGHSIAYTPILLTDGFLPQNLIYAIYLLLVGAPPLLSSHPALRVFGAGLLLAVPVTYFIYYLAAYSVLCFFAALMTLYLAWIVAYDRCEVISMQRPSSSTSFGG